MVSIVSVAALCCTLLLFQHVAAGPLDNQVEDPVKILDFPRSFTLNGTFTAFSSNWDFSMRVSEPLNSMRMEIVGNWLEYHGIVERRWLFLGNDGSYGSERVYARVVGHHPTCHVIRGSAFKPITVRTTLSDNDVHFDDVKIVNGEELEKWVEESKELHIEFYIKRNEMNQAVPVRLVVTKSSGKHVVTFDVREFSKEPVHESAFDYDSSFVCTEIQYDGSGNSNGLGLSANISKREVQDEAAPLNIISSLITNYFS